MVKIALLGDFDQGQTASLLAILTLSQIRIFFDSYLAQIKTQRFLI
jgi:hypothetical protein